MRAFLTGSRVYGEPDTESDWDVVVYMDEETRDMLSRLSDAYNKQPKGRAPIKFGPVNLIPATSEVEYLTWLFGTRRLRMHQRVTQRAVCRDTAVELFQLLWRFVGAYEDWQKDPEMHCPPSLPLERFEEILEERGMSETEKNKERRKRRRRERFWWVEAMRPPVW